MLGDGAADELPGGRVGQVRGRDVGLGPLVRGEPGRGGGPQGLLGGRSVGAALGNVGGADLLSPLLVGQAEDGHLGDAVDGGQDVLDFGGVDVDAAADDEVVAPAGQVEEVVGIEAAQVADGARRPVPGGRGGGGVVPVTEAGEGRHVAPDGAADVI